MDVHLVDGTYELFRHYFAVPPHRDSGGVEVGAVRGVLDSLVSLLGEGATHVGVATDHVVESFRNELWADYKTGEGIEPELRAQFEILEEGIEALGVKLFPMVEREADDGMASAAAVAADDPRVGRVWICTPDKDLAQCVGGKIVQLDRRKRVTYDSAGVEEKFGVPPSAIPDYLALVGDSADGFPGLKGWGAKSSAAVLSRYGSLEAIPLDAEKWDVKVRGAAKLAAVLAEERDRALLFKDLALLRPLPAVIENVDELAWRGPGRGFEGFCERLRAPRTFERAQALRA